MPSLRGISPPHPTHTPPASTLPHVPPARPSEARKGQFRVDHRAPVCLHSSEASPVPPMENEAVMAADIVAIDRPRRRATAETSFAIAFGRLDRDQVQLDNGILTGEGLKDVINQCAKTRLLDTPQPALFRCAKSCQPETFPTRGYLSLYVNTLPEICIIRFFEKRARGRFSLRLIPTPGRVRRAGLWVGSGLSNYKG